MSVHYRFKSALEYDTITFDGLHISVKDLKNSIIQQKRIGKSTDFDLRITNAQTQEVYEDEHALIPKNTSLLIARIPVAVPKQKQWEGYGGNDTPPAKIDEGGAIGKAVDLAKLDAPEDDKIKAMMSQSTQDYDPSNYVKIRGANQVGPVPPSYRCYKCHQTGHWIKDCPLGQGGDSLEIKKSTGIPQSFMVPVEGPQVPGAMMTPNGQYAVPALDYQAYSQKNPPPAVVQEAKPEIPEDLLCSICADLLTDAVMIPCCGNSFCDECIRTVLLESEDHECPDCHEKEISPGTLIPNRFLRKSVANFKNTTGYEKKPMYKEKSLTEVPKTEPSKREYTPPPVTADSTEREKGKSEEEKTVISEADSTEQAKSEDLGKEGDLDPSKLKISNSPDRPPGVSPPISGSPKHQIKSKVNSRERDHRKHRSRRSESPPIKSRHRRSPSYHGRSPPERHGTPTRDEPPGIGGHYHPTNPSQYGSGAGGPSSAGASSISGQGSASALPPGNFPPGQQPHLSGFPPQGPPPNFGLPPPGAPPFMGPGSYSVAPRPVFDPSRPPLGAPPGSYPPGYGGGRSHRDYNRGRNRTPPMLIEDPLTAFNRILREKDERRAKQRYIRRSWSRSRSRSYSRSPPPRRRSRSPRRRSRSRSFSISRSRSRSFSKSPRGSPYRPGSPASRRSPLPPPASRKGTSRYRSPIRSPPPRRGRNLERERDRDYDNRDYRDERGSYRDKGRRERRDSRERLFDEREFDRDRKGRSGPAPLQAQLWNPPSARDAYYPPPGIQPPPAMLPQQPGFPNRYPTRDYHPPPHMAPPIQNLPPQRRFDDIAPPGVEEPPIPGLESELPEVNEYSRKPVEVKEKYGSPKAEDRERSKRERRSRSRSPERWRNPSPKPRGETPEKPRKRRSSSDRDDRKKDRDHSDDERKKNKEKRKHREKKEDKKKKRDKKDKHRRSEKEKKEKGKEEFKQVIPKTVDESEDDGNGIKKRLGERRSKAETVDDSKEKESSRSHRKKEREEEERIREEKRLAEERKKEERRLRFLEDEKKRKNEEAKKKAAEEARRKALVEEEEFEAKPKGTDLYDDVLSEKEKAVVDEVAESFAKPEPQKEVEEGEVLTEENRTAPKEIEDEDAGILELHSSDMDIKIESDILAPLPEKSKWEVDEDGQVAQTSPTENGKDKSDPKTAKVTNEVLKRAENAIFAKAINAIRPIEIKRISSDRAKLYSDEKPEPAEETKKPIDLTHEKPKLSIKDRLGVKVDDNDRVILVDGQHRGRTVSPFSRRERRIELDESRRHDKSTRSRSRKREMSQDRQKEMKAKDPKKIDRNKRESRKDEPRPKGRIEEKKDKRKRSRSKSENEDHRRKKKERKTKRDKSKKREDGKDEPERKESQEKEMKRKTTLDESSFEPDYDLELHTDGGSSDEGKGKKISKKNDESDEEESSSSDSSSSSSEEERRKKRHKRHRKKRKRESSSSSSESSSESSDSEREKKRKKHRKTKKKKKKSKHK
ncbi:E3 ubiquitin-protein ligase RBBP6 isoform X2 [Cylas formicarius]|uniref:E3 ubiquitin-protein ligase RBBP6 isoform X2 n=1 Tax=Cylas formicarius TaxID=197179 RepID=UPI0029584177|nr:E3 ubiquitin-protein ligase RBBP6 isoform X2 [Cylas formicarius]